MNTPLVEASDQASKDIAASMSHRYSAGLAKIKEPQNWAAVLGRFEEAIGLDDLTTDTKEGLYDKILAAGRSALTVKAKRLPTPEPSATHPLGDVLERLKGLVDDPSVANGPNDFRDTIGAFVTKEMDKFPHDAGSNHLVYWEDVMDSYNDFIRQWLPSPTKDHTIAGRSSYDIARELGKKYLRVRGPDLNIDAPAVAQVDSAAHLFSGLKDLQAAVTDAMSSAPHSLGDISRKVNVFVESEKDKLYSLITDKNLKADYKRSLEVRKRLEDLFSDPASAARAMRQSELPASENGGFTAFIDEVDSLLHKADRAAGRRERVTFGDYAKNAAASNFFENRKIPPLLSTQNVVAPVQAAARPRYLPEVAVRSAWKLPQHPKVVEWWLDKKEEPIASAVDKTWRTLNLFNRLPEGARPNKWHLLNTGIDENDSDINKLYKEK